MANNIITFSALVRGMIRNNATAIKSFFHRPTRQSYLESVRTYQDVYLLEPHLRRVSATEFIDDSEGIELTSCIRNEWQTTLVELAVIVGFVKKRAPESIFEIGTFDGRTTLAMHLNSSQSQIHTIDLPGGTENSPGGNEPGYLFHGRQLGGKIRQLYGNTLTFDFSPWWGRQDFVFVDAGHSYQNALADSKTALQLVEGREGAVIWHDYAVMPGVTKAVEEVREHVESPAEFVWIEGTSLALLICSPDCPLRLDGEYSRASLRVEQATVAVEEIV